MKIIERIKRFFHFQQTLAADDLLWEVHELRHVFALLTVGSFTGLPGAPLPVTLELLPVMEEELILMLDKIPLAADPLSDQFGRLDAV